MLDRQKPSSAMHSLRVTCPACEKPMKEIGSAFHCEPCREIIIFFAVSDASPYVTARRVLPKDEC
jgi:hypothetical protein